MCDAYEFVPVGESYHGKERGGTTEEDGLNYTSVEQQQKVAVKLLDVL